MFKLSRRSLGNLSGVHPHLCLVVKRAIELTDVDFTVTCGLRSISDQKKAVAAGTSKTMRSRHLTGHAVDLAAWVEGGVSWDFVHYPRIALAMKRAAEEIHIPIEWGAVWDIPLERLTDNLAKEARAYAARQRRKGVKPLIDAPHFQLPRTIYP